MAEPLIQKYAHVLPVTTNTPIISLMEGATPLIESKRLCKVIQELRYVQLFFKVEGANPTGSFKDRGMTMAISKAVENGSRAVICASTGNTSASAAAYSARAGLR